MIDLINECDEQLAKELEIIENEIFSTAWPYQTIQCKINNHY